MIYAKSVDEKLHAELPNFGCLGDVFDNATLPCVVDLERRVCTFDSMRLPYTGFNYPAINRGIRIIKKLLFNNKFTLTDSKETYDDRISNHKEKPDPLLYDFDTNMSLWSFWRAMKKSLILDEKKFKNTFEKMRHGEIVFDGGYIYLKWEERGVWLAVETNEELKTVQIDAVDLWSYPKTNKIAKNTVKEIRELIDLYFAGLGYTTRYNSDD